MAGDVEVLVLDCQWHDVRDEDLDDLCSQFLLDDHVVPEPLDDEIVANLFALPYVDDEVVLPPKFLDVGDLVVLIELLNFDVLDLMFYDDVALFSLNFPMF